MEAVDQPPAETNSNETIEAPQKCRADNQWIAGRGIVSRDNMVQQIMMERYFLLARTTSLQGHVEKSKAETSQLAHQKFLDEHSF